jgi:hypothetical protein
LEHIKLSLRISEWFLTGRAGEERRGRLQPSRVGSCEHSARAPSPSISRAAVLKSAAGRAATLLNDGAGLAQTTPSGVWGILGTPTVAPVKVLRAVEDGTAHSRSCEGNSSHCDRAKSIPAGSVSPAASSCGGGARGRARSVGAGGVEEDARHTWREQRRVVREEMQR